METIIFADGRLQRKPPGAWRESLVSLGLGTLLWVPGQQEDRLGAGLDLQKSRDTEEDEGRSLGGDSLHPDTSWVREGRSWKRRYQWRTELICAVSGLTTTLPWDVGGDGGEGGRPPVPLV